FKNFIKVYINDVIIYNNKPKDYIYYLNAFFNLFDKIRFILNLKKTFFKYKSIKLFNFNINGKGILVIKD
ncbi:hypothetical protein K449DRAFT_334239, partial [Hypoxylon sp. EC38]